MHDISVASDSHDTTRENGVLIVRPNYGSQATATPQPINSAEDNFVIHPEHRESVRTSDKMERSAIAPDGVALASAGADVGRGAQIVKVSADAESNTKGQFEPSSARVFHAHGPDASASASSSGASAQSAGASNSPFVFQ
jgi:hypothetical protein